MFFVDVVIPAAARDGAFIITSRSDAFHPLRMSIGENLYAFNVRRRRVSLLMLGTVSSSMLTRSSDVCRWTNHESEGVVGYFY